MNCEASSESVDGRAVANFVLDFCDQRGRAITNLSLQKIVYFCHVWSLIELERPLVKHQFEAWQFGPVLQYLYREFKDFDNKPITKRATRLDPKTGTREVVDYIFDPKLMLLLHRVADFYSRIRAGDLVGLTHARGGPWDRTWNHESRANPGMRIDNKSIVEYYSVVQAPFILQ